MSSRGDLEEEIKMPKMTDKERLDWLEKTQLSLISDDFGNWVVCSDGFQNIPLNPPDDIQTTFFIEKKHWCKSVRKAVDKACKAENIIGKNG